MITNAQSGTNVHEIADGIYRISTPLSVVPGGARVSTRRSLTAGHAFVKRLPGESIPTPCRQSGHSASGQDGTESDRSERDGTEKAPAGRPRSTIEPTARTRPPAAETAAEASRVDLPVVKTSSTTTTGSPRSSAKPRRRPNAPVCASLRQAPLPPYFGRRFDDNHMRIIYIYA